ncbi:MAG: thiolase family protein [Schwartzia sp.]|nr:thiolase family protein [Schwartzia sp. (in: firmicutes)]
MEEVFVLGALRTPIVTKNGRFKSLPAEVLGASVMRALIRDFPEAGKCLDGVIGGNAVGTGGNIARLAALTAGIDAQVPAWTIDMQCASAAAALAAAYHAIACGEGDVYLAGGMESSSLQPLRVYDSKDARRAKTPAGDGAYYTAQFSPGDLDPQTMLKGAERVAKAEGVTKDALDAWAIESHRRAAEAQRRGVLAQSIVEVEGWSKDDGIRPRMSQKLLDRLPLLFGEGSVTTAGTSCLINDGAAFALLVSGRWLRARGLHAPARILGTCALGGNPDESPRGAMRTADALLTRHGLTYEELTAIEFNEAFAVIDVLFERRCPNLLDRYNPLGGALAYGHPYGASGAVLLVHLLASLAVRGGGLGLLSIAGAGGMGEALLIEGDGGYAAKKSGARE